MRDKHVVIGGYAGVQITKYSMGVSIVIYLVSIMTKKVSKMFMVEIKT